MSESKKINIALIGYGFMGRAHSHAYRDMPMFFETAAVPVLKVICDQNEELAKKAVRRFGWEEYETSWRKAIARKDINLVDISSPGDTHKEIALAAARAGKDIFCEKPLANNLSDAREILATVGQAGVKHMIGFNYRRAPAIALAKQLIDGGKIGKIYHFRAVYLQEWLVDPRWPLFWRLQKEKAGSGPHGDLNAHLIDTARYLVGDIDRVVGMSETFIKKRPLPESPEKYGAVTVDDATLFLARFKGEALASFEATRFATGRKSYQRIEINGSKGSLVFNLERLNELEYYSREDGPDEQGFRTILVTEKTHPYLSAWWPRGHILGYEHTVIHEVYEFMQALARNEMPSPNFEDGVKCQAVLEAVERSVKEERWVGVDEL